MDACEAWSSSGCLYLARLIAFQGLFLKEYMRILKKRSLKPHSIIIDPSASYQSKKPLQSLSMPQQPQFVMRVTIDLLNPYTLY